MQTPTTEPTPGDADNGDADETVTPDEVVTPDDDPTTGDDSTT